MVRVEAAALLLPMFTDSLLLEERERWRGGEERERLTGRQMKGNGERHLKRGWSKIVEGKETNNRDLRVMGRGLKERGRRWMKMRTWCLMGEKGSDRGEREEAKVTGRREKR